MGKLVFLIKGQNKAARVSEQGAALRKILGSQ
jgi:hypothetical protein